MSDLPNCPLCGGNDLKLVASRPNANSSRVECACGVAGEWGKGDDGARAGWERLDAVLYQPIRREAAAFEVAQTAAEDAIRQPVRPSKRPKGGAL